MLACAGHGAGYPLHLDSIPINIPGRGLPSLSSSPCVSNLPQVPSRWMIMLDSGSPILTRSPHGPVTVARTPVSFPTLLPIEANVLFASVDGNSDGNPNPPTPAEKNLEVAGQVATSNDHPGTSIRRTIVPPPAAPGSSKEFLVCTLRPVACPPSCFDGQPRLQSRLKVTCCLLKGVDVDAGRRLLVRHASKTVLKVVRTSIPLIHSSLVPVRVPRCRAGRPPSSPPFLQRCARRRFH